jgi:predicted dithiol-disulfide oxidoreductase (DUF899 family)
MVEVDATTTVVGPDGPTALIDVFEGRRQLVVYFHMWHEGEGAPNQCEGCTFFNGQVQELSYVHSRDVTYATFIEGPYEEGARYRDFMGYGGPWYSAQDSKDVLLADRWFGMLVSYLQLDGRVYETSWTTGRGTEVMTPSYGILDRAVYGRQETFEDSPVGWPQFWGNDGGQFRMNGRPTSQWSRLAAGRSDDLSASRA